MSGFAAAARSSEPLGAEAQMRVVHCTRALYLGGTEGQLVELLRGLQGRASVHLALLRAEGPLLAEVRSLGLEPSVFPLGPSLLRAGTAWQIARMARWFRTIGAELVHVHDFYATLFAVPAARLARCKVVVSRLDLAHWQTGLQRAALAEATRRADHVVTNAEAIAAQLTSREGVPRERISVIHNGLDLGRFDAAVAAGPHAPLPPGEGPVVVHVANMNHPVKRQEDLLDALALLNARGRELRAWFVGDGPRRPLLERRARALGIAGQVAFLGHRRDVPAVLQAATAAVLCSTAEGLPNAVMEAMAAGRPVVATRVGGIPELVRDGETGFLVEPCSPPALAAAMERVLHGSLASERMGAAGRRVIAEAFPASGLVDRHAELYRSVLGDR